MNDWNLASGAIDRAVEAMVADRSGNRNVEPTINRSADYVRAGATHGPDHVCQPVRAGDFVIIYHPNILSRGEPR